MLLVGHSAPALQCWHDGPRTPDNAMSKLSPPMTEGWWPCTHLNPCMVILWLKVDTNHLWWFWGLSGVVSLVLVDGILWWIGVSKHDPTNTGIFHGNWWFFQHSYSVNGVFAHKLYYSSRRLCNKLPEGIKFGSRLKSLWANRRSTWLRRIEITTSIL